jgi:single-stranded DNA-binding protein
MNSCILMVEVVSEPELRRTPDSGNAIASFLVHIPANRSEDAPQKLRVVGWNNLADEIMNRYHTGDQIVVEGRLRIDTVDRGTHKEKRTELVAQRIHGMAASAEAPLDYGDRSAGVYAVGAAVVSPPPVPQPMPDFDDNIPF